jgi:uncharacterized protein YndB with AHSA1/START domain
MNLSQLVLEVPADKPLIIWQRLVAAPPELVFDAWTKPEHLRHWWGPRWLQLTICEVDLRVGGGYRFVQRSLDGTEHGFHGSYLEIDRPRRLVSTVLYAGSPKREAIDTVDFEPVADGTLLHGRSEHDSIETRDAHLAIGMERGMTDTLDRLDEWSIAHSQAVNP